MDPSTVSASDLTQGPPSVEAEIKAQGDANADIHEQSQGSQHASKRHDLMAKVKRKLNPHDHTPPATGSGSITTLADVKNVFDAASVSSRLDHHDPSTQKSTASNLLHSPVETVKSAVHGQLAKEIANSVVATEISHDHDVRLIEAHDFALRAKTSREKLTATEQRDQLLKAREVELVRWSLDRHLTRVRALSDDPPTLLPKERFQVTDQQGKPRTDWKAYVAHLSRVYAERHGESYVGYGLFPPPASQMVITAAIERLLVVSGPLQQWVVRIRSVYRWEEPAKTTTYLVIFMLLWSLDLLLPGLLLTVIMMVLYRGNSSPNIEDLRQTIQRIEDMSRQSESFTEFVGKEGDTNWIQPLIDAAGNTVLIQLGDLASLMEILRNFYDWRSPYYTAVSLSILVAILAVVTITPTWLIVKCSTLGMGFAFFALFPISSRYPDYRLLVSPRAWLLWKVPTHAEWAMSTIKSRRTRNKCADAQTGTAAEVGRYSCAYEGHNGHLVLASEKARFETTVRSKVHWELSYGSILRMEKINGTPQSSDCDLEITSNDQAKFLLHKLSGRNEVFNQIIANTDIRWLPEW